VRVRLWVRVRVRLCVCVCAGLFHFSFAIGLLAVGDTKGGACLGLCFLPSDNPF
jgi:hypothetical protein